MADELELNLDEDKDEDINRTEERIKKLSEKVKLTAKERDELKAEAEKVKAEKEALAREAGFYKDFSKVSTKYQGATDYQDKIWEKHKSGYSVEDAVVSTLVAEGKYTPPAQPEVKEVVAGGSAATGITDSDKSLNEMSAEDKRKEIEKLSFGEVFGK